MQTIPSPQLLHGDCRAVVPTLTEASVGAVITDPPYDLLARSRNGSGRSNNPDTPAGRHGARAGGFMGAAWDATGVAFDPATWQAILRVLKPGAYCAAFGGTRSFHRLFCAMEDGGFEPVDCLLWLYGTGTPKSRSSLKPAYEPIALMRKPRTLSVDANMARYGVGALEIEACRLEPRERTSYDVATATSKGRWPNNVLFDQTSAALLDAQAPPSRSRTGTPRAASAPGEGWGMTHTGAEYDDEGGPSRFFWVAKSHGEERHAGVDGGNTHSTVKPLELMRRLCTLLVPAGGTVLDPFLGSGSTGIAAQQCGLGFIGIEQDADYLQIAAQRIAYWSAHA